MAPRREIDPYKFQHPFIVDVLKNPPKTRQEAYHLFVSIVGKRVVKNNIPDGTQLNIFENVYLPTKSAAISLIVQTNLGIPEQTLKTNDKLTDRIGKPATGVALVYLNSIGWRIDDE